MFEFLFKKLPFNSRFRTQLLIGSVLGGIVVFIMLFLQPFGTYGFESNYKYLIFLGFGIVLSLAYVVWSRVENKWYLRNGQNWLVRDEVVSFLLFMLSASIPIHFYNQVFLNDLLTTPFNGFEYLMHGLWFFKSSIMPIFAILLPFYTYLRNKFGKFMSTSESNQVDIFGSNKHEKLRVKKEDLLFVRASENYVEIHFTDNDVVQQKTFRNTLTEIQKQVPFLLKSHRSFLVNASAIKEIRGNSQNAKLAIHPDDREIPLSKSFYKSIKHSLNI